MTTTDQRPQITHCRGAGKTSVCIHYTGNREVNYCYITDLVIIIMQVQLISCIHVCICCSCRLLVTERTGLVCRDDSVEGLRFYPNRFLYPDLDSQS